MHAKFLQSLNRRPDAGKRGLANVFNEDLLRGRCAALHAVHHNHIGAGFHRQCGIVIGSRPADFYVDGNPPIGNFAQFSNFNFKVIRASPVWMAAGGALVNAFWQAAHFCHAVGNLLAQQHAAAPGLCSLANHHFHGVRAA